MLKFIQACSSLLLFQLLSPGCRTTALCILNQFLEVPAQVILVWGCFSEWWLWGGGGELWGFFLFFSFLEVRKKESYVRPNEKTKIDHLREHRFHSFMILAFSGASWDKTHSNCELKTPQRHDQGDSRGWNTFEMRTESKGKPGCSKDGNMTNASQATQREDWPEVVWALVQKGQKWTTLQPTQTNSNKQRGIIDAHPEQSKLRRWDQVNRCFSPWTPTAFYTPQGLRYKCSHKGLLLQGPEPSLPSKGKGKVLLPMVTLISHELRLCSCNNFTHRIFSHVGSCFPKHLTAMPEELHTSTREIQV